MGDQVCAVSLGWTEARGREPDPRRQSRADRGQGDALLLGGGANFNLDCSMSKCGTCAAKMGGFDSGVKPMLEDLAEREF